MSDACGTCANKRKCQRTEYSEMNRRADVDGLLFVTTQDGCLA